ncbi:Eco57I restriction-modification methylase domain-containing protein [Bernardetia sp. ABR2-2B]|uniref:type IIG restriction enzyme/methyltransferase n=1 Tax=Bernardetia sp. ABR2-2B TaxID=3127472 RepID=UPI0030CF63EE
MKFSKQTPAQSLNQAYRKEHVEIKEFEKFRVALEKLLDEMEKQREENTKVLMSDFLKDAYYKNLHAINPAVDVDTVIHHQDTQKSPVGVMIENKKPNSSEFVSTENLNKKSFQQLIFYYLKERIENKNTEVKRLIITDVYEWFVFDETEFDKVFYQNKGLVKKYKDAIRDKKSTKHFYEEIAQHFIANSEQEITYTHFDLREYQKELENFKINLDKKGKEQDEETDPKAQKEEKKLIHLYKILSPVHLLKKPFANDSNSLNKDFYNELLHILGLEEVKEKNKKVIKRKNEKDREIGSFLENALSKLERKRPERIENYKSYGENDAERVENIALELCITWTNRILFLKLLEAQLLQYHKAEKKPVRQKYKFLNIQTIEDFNVLDDLFFGVLAKKPKERREYLNDFAHIPYLNSSLFEETSLESETVNASHLSDNAELTLYSKTVLKNDDGVRRTGKETPLSYLFQFLDAYNFSSEGTEEIRKDKKTLINASVLGLIFEKINGYKDGSFYTPSFITMYMCRQTLRRAVVQKFSEEYKMEFENFEDLQEFLQPQYKSADKLKNNKIFDSLKICDPAVGSGHFLVSALNELIVIKSELGILADETGKGLPVEIRIENDELFAFETANDFFEYQIANKQSQTIQKTLFHEKQKLIENCLFGVDINPNSVKICRLRLWIELLKNAYYTGESNFEDLETLPNIDINIKTGNSLISRFDLDADISKALKKSKWSIDSYRVAVQTYRNATSKEQKYEMEKLIDTIKTDFRSEISKKDPKVLSLSKKSAELQTLLTQTSVFELSKAEQKAKDKKIEKLKKEVLKLNTEIEDIKSNKIYQNAFEWRFEFPEVLDDKGNFIGFDVVIGNPPYGVKVEQEKEHYKINSNESAILFIQLAKLILKNKGVHAFIVPKPLIYATTWKDIRSDIFDEIYMLGDCSRAWKEVLLEAIIYVMIKDSKQDKYLNFIATEETISIQDYISKKDCVYFDFLLNDVDKEELDLAYKISLNRDVIDKYCSSNWGDTFYKKVEEKGEVTVLAGANIQPFYIRGEKGFIPKQLKISPKADILPNSILLQRIIAHITRPNNHIRITGTIAENLDSKILNTVQQLTFTPDLNNKFALGLMTSKMINWFAYRFIFAKAIRTFQFSSSIFSKIPIVRNKEIEKAIIEKVSQILSLKKANPSADTSALESEIDVLVYALYGLSEEEISVISEQ